MTKKAGSKRKKRTYGVSVWPTLKNLFVLLRRRGAFGVLLLSLAIVTLLNLLHLNSGGFLVNWWSRLLRQGFGWGSYTIVLTVAGLGGVLAAGKAVDLRTVRWHTVVGIEIVLLALLGLTHLYFSGADPWEAAQAGEMGGYVGALFSSMLQEALGQWPAGLVLGAVLFWGAIMASGRPVEAWVNRLEVWFARAWRSALEGVANFGRWLSGRVGQLTTRPRPQEAVPQHQAARSVDAIPESPCVSGSDRSARPSRVGHTRRLRVTLPPLELLDEPADAAVDEAESRRKAEVIERTLGHFGVPARVVEVNRGPIVTQFGVEPGYVKRRDHTGGETERKIRVAKIASLNKDLALALAASPIRVEAPVPGRSIVGIEVPNNQVSVVPLRQVMSTGAFRRGRSHLKLALGEGVAGTPVIADLTKMPHLLIAGATGSGKSMCINAIAMCLLFQNAPSTLRLVMIDPKRVELSRYSGLPHLYGQVESDPERVVGVLRWLVSEMQQRYKKLSQAGVRHVDEYNRHWREGSKEYLPRIVVLIDELADLMLFAPDDVEQSICRLAQMARATGMHLVLATQRPSVDVVTGLIKANFPARIGFAVSSGMDSRVILDAVGAEMLLSKGDMLYMAPDASSLVRAQGVFVSEAEMERVTHYWQDWGESEEWGGRSVSEGVPAPWDAVLEQENEPEEDELLLRAISIVREQGSASASLLQRRMRIGYPRASRLIDEMEERGIVGPAESGGRPREVMDMGQERA